MIIEKRGLWNSKKQSSYTMYLLNNSAEIDAGRKHPAIVICGGGGFMRISEREKQPVALYYLNHGFQVFVLDYITKSTGVATYPGPVTDLAKMLQTIRSHAQEWAVDPDKIAVIGFSTGGQICASLATQWHTDLLRKKVDETASPEVFKPNAVVLCYPLLDYLYQMERLASEEGSNGFSPSIGMKKSDFIPMLVEAGVGLQPTQAQYKKASPIQHVTEKTPPTFIWHTAQDELIYAGQSLRYAEKLAVCGVPYELHVFEEGPHGLSMATEEATNNPELINPAAAEWAGWSVRFLKRHLR